MWVKKKRQIVCEHQMCEQASVMVALPGARIADNYKIKSEKSVGWSRSKSVHLRIRDFWLVVPKEFCRLRSKFLPETVPGEEVFSPFRLLRWNHRAFYHSKTADALSMRGVAHEVAAIYDTWTSKTTDWLTVAADALSVRRSGATKSTKTRMCLVVTVWRNVC